MMLSTVYHVCHEGGTENTCLHVIFPITSATSLVYYSLTKNVIQRHCCLLVSVLYIKIMQHFVGAKFKRLLLCRTQPFIISLFL